MAVTRERPIPVAVSDCALRSRLSTPHGSTIICNPAESYPRTIVTYIAGDTGCLPPLHDCSQSIDNEQHLVFDIWFTLERDVLVTSTDRLLRDLHVPRPVALDVDPSSAGGTDTGQTIQIGWIRIDCLWANCLQPASNTMTLLLRRSLPKPKYSISIAS